MSLERFERRVCADSRAVSTLRSGVVAFAAGAGATDAVRDAIALAVSEAVTNVVMHAYVGMPRGDVLVEAWVGADDHLLVKVSDKGVGMRPRIDSPGLGVGLTLIAQMTDDLRIVERRDSGGVVVSMRFALDGPGTLSRKDEIGSIRPDGDAGWREFWKR